MRYILPTHFRAVYLRNQILLRISIIKVNNYIVFHIFSHRLNLKFLFVKYNLPSFGHGTHVVVVTTSFFELIQNLNRIILFITIFIYCLYSTPSAEKIFLHLRE